MPTPLLTNEDDLIEAVKCGRESKVRTLLMCGGNVEAVDKEGKTAFHWACQYGHLNILCLLLSHTHTRQHHPPPPPSTSPDCQDLGVCSACKRLRRANDNDDDIQTQPSTQSLQNQPGPGGFLQIQSKVLNKGEEGKNNNDRPVGNGDVENGNVENNSITGLENVGNNVANDNVVKDSPVNDTLLGNESEGGHGGQLDRRGNARIDTNSSCTCNNKTSRHRSSHLINARDLKGQTPLHVACNYRRADMASFLVTLPFCEVDVPDKAGNTPLHRAIHNQLNTVACLLCDAGANVKAANHQLHTPLHEAIRSAEENVVRELLSKGCDVNAATKSTAAPTPFLTAVFYYKISAKSSRHTAFLDTTLRLLIEFGCKLSQGDYQWTPLSAAVDIDNSFIASLLLFNGCRFQRNFSLRGYGRSLLVEAFTHCDAGVVKLLVLCGYQPSVEEAEQCSRRIPYFSPLFYRISGSERAAVRSKTELLAWLRHRACNSRSLMELSRERVREALNRATGDTSILETIPRLPLPKVLQQYVTLSDFTENRL